MTEAVVALDPGGTTGWAAWETDAEWSHGQLTTPDHHDALYRLLGTFFISHTNVKIVCESFEFRQWGEGDDMRRRGINLISREYIGVAKLFAQHFNGVSLVLQTPAQAKSFVTDEKLKIMGLWVPGQQHARDAYRHLVTYLIVRRGRTDLTETWKGLV